MNQLDVVLLVLLVPFALRGLWRGFLREAFGLAGVLGGVLAAAAGGPRLADVLVARHTLSPEAARAAALAGIFVSVYLAAQLLGLVTDRLARAILLGGLNRTAGLAFGVAKGAALLGFALVVLQRAVPQGELPKLIDGSILGLPLSRFAMGLVNVGRGLAGDATGRSA